MMRMSHWFPRLCLLALALTLVLSGIPALAEESEGNAPENPAVILSANPIPITNCMVCSHLS